MEIVIHFIKRGIFPILLGFWIFSTPSHAELTIEITEGIETTVPIAIVPFGWLGTEPRPPIDISEVIESDLSRSGFFKILPEQDMLTRPTDAKQIRFRNWQALGQDYLVIGQIEEFGGKYNLQFQLFNVYKGEQLQGFRFSGITESNLRRTAHHISDIIYEKLTGNIGVFGTRIAYVTSARNSDNKKMYKLQVADADGHNPKTIASSTEPLMSPAWSPDGEKIAYVSFEKKAAAIYVQTLASGQRVKVASYPGINGAPSWSPDGTRLALTLSKGGSPDIYVLNLSDRSLRRLTKNYAIDTEPVWSPDGQNVVFTSDRGGRPQLYMIPVYGGRVKRLTFEGDYNARGVFSPDGKSLAMVHANGGDYRIAVMDMETRTVNVLTAGNADESPGFAPNGSMIIYASRKGNRGYLSVVSLDGKTHKRLGFDRGDIREPAWGPGL